MFNDFNVDEEKDVEEKPKFFGLSKLQIFMIALIIFFLLVILIYNATHKNKDIRIDKSKDIVYTTYKSDLYSQEIPYINIQGEDILKVNEDIQSYTSSFKNNKYSKIKYEYETGTGFDNLLSLIITMKYNSNNKERLYYASYNIDTKNKRQISNNDLLKAYGLTKNDVDNLLKEKFEDFYQDEINNEYFKKEECNFSCYMDLRNIYSIEDIDYSYYVDSNGNLKLYLPFKEDSIYNEQNYFSDGDHVFEIKEKPIN